MCLATRIRQTRGVGDGKSLWKLEANHCRDPPRQPPALLCSPSKAREKSNRHLWTWFYRKVVEGAGLIRCQRRIKRVTQVMNDGALRRRHCLGTDLIWVGKWIDLLLCQKKADKAGRPKINSGTWDSGSWNDMEVAVTLLPLQCERDKAWTAEIIGTPWCPNKGERLKPEQLKLLSLCSPACFCLCFCLLIEVDPGYLHGGTSRSALSDGGLHPAKAPRVENVVCRILPSTVQPGKGYLYWYIEGLVRGPLQDCQVFDTKAWRLYIGKRWIWNNLDGVKAVELCEFMVQQTSPNTCENSIPIYPPGNYSSMFQLGKGKSSSKVPW